MDRRRLAFLPLIGLGIALVHYPGALIAGVALLMVLIYIVEGYYEARGEQWAECRRLAYEADNQINLVTAGHPAGTFGAYPPAVVKLHVLDDGIMHR
ncbi:hypothetical protein JRC04_04940 [Mycolicibacterium sp. S2-37]|uniref:hypothetical protein n=1 Tax=Mycolicibacterium sp. S2-37 TaxID=2810297 RepID=UPI001A93D10E|nr:hypothetical protein [Mycolicibacterium sp. S2-37]MBO0676803.1 hypothetical protein [Mycolicibacterium sp. S2-37]